MDQARYYVDTGLISREAGLALSEPVVKYGVEVNRKVLEKYAEYAFDFGVIPKRVNIDQVFAPSTLGF